MVNLQFFGGRGSSSGISNKGKVYGSQYKPVFEYENIKFVTNAGKNYEALMETMTNGRTYVQIGGEEILRIVQMDENNRRNRVIEFDKKNKQWHVHQGYLHSENSENQHDPLSISDVRLLEKVKKIWHNHRAVSYTHLTLPTKA